MKLWPLGERVGAGGALLSALGCAVCFPLMASLAGYLGLGFLAAYEGLLINTLLPVFVVLVLISHGMTALGARNLWRLVWGVAGPALILATLYLFWGYPWSTGMFYLGLLLMLVVTLWNTLSPPGKTCASGNPRRTVATAFGEA